jgi:tRNA (guanine37-N1)-methyltransferase
MRFDVVSLFPDMFNVVRDLGVTGRAYKQGLWRLGLWNPRDFTKDVHRTVDDRPYGGGPGMVMMAQPLELAVMAAKADRLAHRHGRGHIEATDTSDSDVPVIAMTPTGRRFDQAMAQTLASTGGAIFICGRYEGIDQRFVDRCVTHEVSLGDFVLSGGELAAMAMMDSAVRLLPGALNDADSALQDSFNSSLGGLLDSPHYTRPEQYEGLSVPPELLSGHHVNIAAWRRQQSLTLTAQRRPDLIEKARAQGLLSRADEKFLLSLRDRA